MQIAKHKVVSFDYTLKNDAGQVLDSSEDREPLKYLHGEGNIISGLENELEGKTAGDELSVSIEPKDGYRELRDDLRQEIPRDSFDIDELEVGMQFRVKTTDGGETVVRVVEIQDDTVTIDGNHELAGETLHFDVTIRDVRDATQEEIQHGHAH